MNEKCSSTLLSLLCISIIYGAKVDILPVSVVINKGQNFDIVCNNIEPSNWYSLSIISKCPASDGLVMTEGVAANNPSGNCVQTVSSTSRLGETSFSCNFTVFVFSVTRVVLGANNCQLGCEVYVLDGSKFSKYTHLEVKAIYDAKVDIQPESVVINKGHNFDIVCKNIEPSNWYSLSIISKCPASDGLEKTEGVAANNPSGNCVQTVSSTSRLGKTSFSCNFTVFVFSVSSVVLGANNCKLGCQVYVLDGSRFAKYTNITVKEPLTGPTIKPHEQQTIKENGSRQFVCTTTSFPAARINWYVNDGHVASTTQINISTSTSNLTYTADRRDNNKKIYCTASNDYESANSSYVILNISYPPEVKIDPYQNIYKVINGTRNVAMRCTVIAANPAVNNYTWFKDGTIIDNKSIHTISEVSLGDDGVFVCLGRNDIGSTNSSELKIDVLYGAQLNQIETKQPVEGTQLSIMCTGNSNPKFSDTDVIWTKTNNSSFNMIGELVVNTVNRNDSGIYICTVIVSLVSSEGLTVNLTGTTSVQVDVLYIPTIHMHPKYNPYILCEGQAQINITCVLDDANPRDGVQYIWTHPNGFVNHNVVTLSAVTPEHSGNYSCTAKNSAGISSITEKQIYVQYGPRISNIQNQNITEGRNLTVTPFVSAYPYNTLIWWTRLNETIIYDESLLYIPNIQRGFSGEYFCHAMNTLTPSGKPETNRTSIESFYINVQYSPSVVIIESAYHRVVENGTLSLHCTVENANPPVLTVNWKNYNSIVSETANFTIYNISRAVAGNYTCNAENDIGVGFENVYVDVLYTPNVSFITILNGSLVAENTTVVIQCDIDSNPKSTVQWNLNNGYKKDIFIGTTRSYFTILSTDCYDTGIVYCTATNEIDSNEYKASKQIPIFVSCSPRLDRYIQQPENKIGLPAGGNLNITVYLVAYPRPRMTWNFRHNYTSNKTQIKSNDTQSDLFRHTVYLYKDNLTELEFGLYTLEAKNDIGESLTTFHVVPEGPPEQSKILNASCNGQHATVFWETSFNGGETQLFYVIVYIEDEKYKTVQTSVVSDKKEEVKFAKITLSNGYYSFRVTGTNRYGNASSLDVKSCSITGNTKTEDKSVVAKAAGGGIGAAVAIIGVIATVFIIVKKRRTLKGKQDTGRRQLTDEDRDDDDGLKDNPLYGTSHDTNDTGRAVYSQVNKLSKSSDCDQDIIDGGTVYSQIQKNTNKKKKQKDMEMGDIYENSDKIMKGHHTDKIYANKESNAAREKSKNGQSPESKQNKDGLVYADLDLAPCGKRFVIRGIENRNNYAIIDLTKTAEPLPSDDDDNEEDNKNHESTTAIVE